MAFLLSANCRPTDWWNALGTLEVTTARKQALRIVLAQALTMVVVATVFGIVLGGRAFWSAALGAGIGIVAQVYSMIALLREHRSATATRIAGSFFLGWIMKVLITLVMLVIAFRSQRLSSLPLLGGYIAVIAIYGVAAARATKLPQFRRD